MDGPYGQTIRQAQPSKSEAEMELTMDMYCGNVDYFLVPAVAFALATVYIAPRFTYSLN